MYRKIRNLKLPPGPGFWDKPGSKLMVIAKLVPDLTLHRLCPCKLQLNGSNVACQVAFAQFCSGLGLVRTVILGERGPDSTGLDATEARALRNACFATRRRVSRHQTCEGFVVEAWPRRACGKPNAR